MCLTSSRLSKSLWTPGIGIQNHLFGQLPWIRSWRNCNGAGKPSKTSSRDAPCRVHEKGGKNNSSRLGDTTLVTAFQRTCLLEEWQSLTLSKLRHRLFWLPGELTRPQNRPTLRLVNSPLIAKTGEKILHRVHKLKALEG